MRATSILVLVLAACGGGGSGVDGGGGDDDGGGGGDPLEPVPAVDMDPSHYPANVWVTGAMAKVQPGDAAGDVKWALLMAGRNEVESFQVHVHADGAAADLEVTVSDLVDAASGTHLAATVWREEYMNITTRSDANGLSGRVPDALIPAIDPWFDEPRDAFPVTVPDGEARSAWVDVRVPADAPSGWYLGTVTVRLGGDVLAELPVRLGVWDFTLPPTASLASGFGLGWNSMCVQAYGSYDVCGQYPGAGGDNDRAVELTHVAQTTMFLDYRVSLAGAVYYASGGDWTAFDGRYGPLLDGTADTNLAGARLTHLWYTGDYGDATLLADWTDHFDQQGWLARTSAYFCDEPPNGCSWTETQNRADGIKAAAPDLPTLLTTDLELATANDLLDRVDILVPIVSWIEDRDRADQRASYDGWLADPAKHLWWYQSCVQHESCSNGSVGGATATWPSYMIDASPVRNRVFQWLAWIYRIEGELYYATDYCWTATCGSGTDDPWVSQYAFGGNGDGTLFYPGTPARIGGTTPVALPSIRLALLRDGMEDYEYLRLMADADLGADADAAAASFITNTYTFSDDPADLESARQTLGQRLHDLAHP
ncbi:MAG TPA: glycoside hydrolase domain-containing protein [Kofleriaceae bacterium]|nr:glycoside hydrolase domain-containing protein [Kofleriaceae bacterium]